jgi:hypothetical protein
VGATLASRCRVVRSQYQDLPVDDRIVQYAEECGCMVVTNDRCLREKLLYRHIDVIYLREKKRLDIIRG